MLLQVLLERKTKAEALPLETREKYRYEYDKILADIAEYQAIQIDKKRLEEIGLTASCLYNMGVNNSIGYSERHQTDCMHAFTKLAEGIAANDMNKVLCGFLRISALNGYVNRELDKMAFQEV